MIKNMNEFVTWITSEDVGGKEITAARARRIWKLLSKKLFSEGAQAWLEGGEKLPHGPNFIAHPMLMAMYANGKRQKKGKKK